MLSLLSREMEDIKRPRLDILGVKKKIQWLKFKKKKRKKKRRQGPKDASASAAAPCLARTVSAFSVFRARSGPRPLARSPPSGRLPGQDAPSQLRAPPQAERTASAGGASPRGLNATLPSLCPLRASVPRVPLLRRTLVVSDEDLVP